MIDNLPTINACFNGLATACLVTGYAAIKRGDREKHRKWMLAALTASALFLVGYLTYHFTKGAATKYQKQDWTRPIYFAILLSHTVLAVVTLPLVIATVWRAIKSDFTRHKKIARITFPIWLYVSVTGVLIYLMLYTFGGRG